MSIDRTEFESGMALLGATFRSPVDKPLVRLYFAALDPLLTTAEFRDALARVVRSERFWPTPAVLLEAVGKKPKAEDAKLEGAEAFTALLAMREWGPEGYTLDVRKVADVMGEPGVRALRAIGGPRRLGELTTSDEPFVRKEFAQAFATATAIEQRTVPPALKAMDPDARSLVTETVKALDFKRIAAGERDVPEDAA